MNRTTFRIETIHSVRFLNACKKQGIPVGKVRLEERALILDVQNAYINDIIALSGELCYNYSIVSRSGPLNFLLSFAKRWGMIAGIITVIAALVTSSFFITKIEILGYEKQAEVYDFLAENGIRTLGAKHKIDPEELERMIVSGFDDIAFVSVRMNGMVLKINIEELLVSPPDVPITKISSAYDSIVTRVITSQGTALVSAGDTVRKGDELIGGYYDVGTEDDYVRHELEPIGEVYGRVFHNRQIVVPEKEYKRVRTGNKKTYTYFEVCGYSKPKIPAPEFDLYETEVTAQTIWCIVPVKVHQITYYEVVDVENPLSFETRKNSAIFEARQELSAWVPKEGIITNTWTIEKYQDGLYLITVYVEAEQRIDDGGTV